MGDLRHALKLLRRRPVLSATAILTLMLGIGGTTAVFSLLNSLMLKPLPVSEVTGLVKLVESRRDGSVSEAFILSTQADLQKSSRAFAHIIASSEQFPRAGEVEINGDIQQAFVQFVSVNYFDVLGVKASRGNVFDAISGAAAAEPVAVISSDYWQRQYAGASTAIGSRVRRGNRDVTIIGIAAKDFRGTQLDVPVDVWMSIDQVVPVNSPDRTQGRWMHIMGRLAPGASLVQAQAEASSILGRPIQVERGATGYSALRPKLQRPLLLVSLVVGLVLLIAATNLANLMRAATAARQREIAVRAALGASRGRIVRQLVTESFALSVIGGALGLLVAYWTSGMLLAFLPPNLAVAVPNLRFQIDAGVLAFVALLSFGTCAVFGVLPALRASGAATTSSLKSGSGAGHRSRNVVSRSLLVAQVVMCLVLLIVSGVVVRSVQNLRGQQAGYDEGQLIVADVGFPRSYQEARRDELIEMLRARAAVLPGVSIAAFSHVGQLSGNAIEMKIGFPGTDNDKLDSTLTAIIEQRISPGFLAAMGTPLVLGREFTGADDAASQLVAVVNESFARRFLVGREPIGARFYREGGTHSGEPMEIVGVVRDSKWINLREESPAMYYRPYKQMGGTPMVRMAIRTSGDPEALVRELLTLARSIDKGLALSNVVPFSEIVNRTIVVERLVARMSTAFGALALLIAGIGLYGTLAYSVVRRRREIGLRVAIGGTGRSIERMFLTESLMLMAIGAAIGIPAGIAAARLASSLLFGLGPADPVSLAAALSALGLTVIVATYLPAHRAAKIDPIVVLRED